MEKAGVVKCLPKWYCKACIRNYKLRQKMCICACHDKKHKKGLEHDTRCCAKMNEVKN